MQTVTRELPWRGAYDLVRSLAPLCDGSRDPTWAFTADAGRPRAVRAQWTPVGPATAELTSESESRRVLGRFVGPGAAWLAESMEYLVGMADEPEVPNTESHLVVRDAVRALEGFRIARSLSLLDVLAPTVLGQRVTKGEAHRSFSELVRSHGRRFPGNDEVLLGPDAETMLRLGDADWHALGVERRRADALRVLLRRGEALERAGSLDDPEPADASVTAEFLRVAETLPGIGQWTSTSLASVLLGDPDVVVLGDLHLPNGICWALASEERGDDARMLRLLEPFRPQRGRVVRLLRYRGRASAPRRGPRYTPLPIREL
jgi:3-methyladenine DNA glycosylase/8-oxoguanine DNA glycosylase